MPRHTRPPMLRQKSNGAFFVRIFGRDHSLGSDAVAASARYAELIAANYGPQQALHPGGEPPRGRQDDAHDPDDATTSPISARSPVRGALVAELAAAFLESVRDELDAPASTTVPQLPAGVNRPGTAVAYYRKHLARFLALHGRKGVARLAMPVYSRHIYQPPVVTLMFALRDDMLADGFAPRTVHHDLQAVERLFNWCSARGYCPSVVFTQATMVRVPEPKPLPVPLAWLKADVLRATAPEATPEQHVIGHAAALSYLACLRPSELVRIGHLLQEGPPTTPPYGLLRPVPGAGPGVLSMHGKTTYVTHEERVLPLSDEALERLEWLRQATLRWRQSRPRRRRNVLADGTPAPPRVFPWSSLPAWSSAYRGWTRGHAPTGWASPTDPKTGRPRPPTAACVAPSSLRDSAMTDLDEAGVTLADRQLLLGHVGRGVWRSYDRIAWRRLRELAARLTLR